MNLENITLVLSIICMGLSLVFFVWGITLVQNAKMKTTSGREVNGNIASASKLPTTLNLTAMIVGVVAITVSLAARAIQTGHGPFSSMYEFAMAFSWGVIIMGLYFWWRYRITVISAVGSLVALGLLIYAHTLSSQATPLVPALQQSLLLTTHVASAVISYGAFTIGFGSAVVYLLRSKEGKESQILDEISYHTVLVGFPFMTLLIILGALWADIAWGRYWSWDPKETASLVTWLLYATYLHARVMRGWKGRRAAILLIIGFAAILVTFFGNYIFSGLHSYG